MITDNQDLDFQDFPDIPEGINLPIIKMIHRGKDSYIPFMRKRKDGAGLENLFSIPVAELHTYFPQMLEWLQQDAYMGINSCYRTAPYNSKITGLPGVWRGRGFLRRLNAIYLDLDVGRPESKIKEQRTPWLIARHKAEAMMEAGKIPQASMIARSGRGIYLLWLIRDKDNPDLPARAWPENMQVWENISRSFIKKLKHLAADPTSVDPAKVLKAPGTIDTRTGKRVRYVIYLDDNAQPFHYSLDELKEALLPGDRGEALPRRGWGIEFPGIRQVKKKGSLPQNLAGQKAKNLYRVRDLFKIEAWLQGFPQGKRRISLTLLAECLKYSGTDEAGIRSVLESKAERCRPPYPSEQGDSPLETIIKGVLNSGQKLGWFGNAAICRDYGITRKVAIELELESIMPADLMAELKAEKKAQIKQEKAAEREAARAELKAAIKRLWEGSGKNFSYRDLKAPLADEGFPISHETIRKYLIELKEKQWGKP